MKRFQFITDKSLELFDMQIGRKPFFLSSYSFWPYVKKSLMTPDLNYRPKTAEHVLNYFKTFE